MDTPQITECPSPDQLRGLLSGVLVGGEQESLTQHIESCPACQRTLDEWLNSPSVEGLAAAGKNSATQEVALRELMAGIKKKATGEETQAEPGAASDNDLAYLQPTSKPGVLGCLNHYEVLAVLGRGGFGTVFKALDTRLQRMVAIKVLASELAANGSARKRFIREGQAAAAVKNEHVVAIYSVEDNDSPRSSGREGAEVGGMPYLVMELIDGISLQDRIDRSGSLELREILRIGMQMAEGLAAAHKQGLIHRDIKPANILLENGVQRVKITDFGLARLTDDASITQSGVIAGTPMYMAPEQAQGEALDHRADLFSLGSVLYTLCTGRPPFRAAGALAVLKRVCEETARPIREVNPEIPTWLEAIITRLHAKDPRERFQTAKEVAELLGRCLADVQAGRAVPGGADHGPVQGAIPVGSAPAPSRRKRWFVIPALFLLILSLWLVRYFWAIPGSPPSPTGKLHLHWDDPTLVLSLRADATGEVVFNSRTEVNAQLRVPPGFSVHRSGPQPSADFTLPSGAYTLSVHRDDQFLYDEAVQVQGGKETALFAPHQKTAWVKLFNGKDLTGWKYHSKHPGNWTVQDGVLSSGGPGSYLYTERGDYQDFRLRVEVQLNRGYSGIFFRTPFGSTWSDLAQQPGLNGYNVAITHPNHPHPTGTLRLAPNLLELAPEGLFKLEQWCVLEVLVQGDRLASFVDGKPAATLIDPQWTYHRGHIALQHLQPQIEVRLRKIEIQELPPPPGKYALSFSGGNDHVELPVTYDGKHPITLEAWVKVPQTPERVMTILGNDALALGLNKDGHWMAFVQDLAEGGASSQRHVWSDEPADAGRYTHVALVLFGRAGRLFVDGRRVMTKAALRGDHVPSATPFVMGGQRAQNQLTRPFVGDIDALRISRTARYDRNFTPEKFKNDTSTMALYECNEGHGNVLRDRSGQGHHGKIIGARWVRGRSNGE